jgi:predicted nuclease with RNAse H fold
MSPNGQAVVGIDVGGKRKGFHAVALRNGVFEKPIRSANPAEIIEWCRKRDADVIAVDAPCGWSQSGSSRAAERELVAKGIRCFATPTRIHAQNHKKGFYGWVFNGEELYRLLRTHYRLFDGALGKWPACFETFPHAIVCAMAGKVVPAKPKKIGRLRVLSERNYDVRLLSSIDFIDAALCAVAAEEFRKGRIGQFGTRDEGIIVVPELAVRAA